MLLNFSAGEDCTCPEELQEELQGFHDDLRLHCGLYLSILSIVHLRSHPIFLHIFLPIKCVERSNQFKILLYMSL